MQKIIRIFFGILGVAVSANAILLCFLSNLNTGIFLTFALGTFFLLCALLWTKIPKAIKYTIIAGILILATVLSIFYLYGSFDNVTYGEDVLIVLGAGIHGSEITKDLQKRLDAAVWFHQKNPSALIVVSGGQGSGEDITEALAMQQYLVKQGVPSDKILQEDKASSTNENFLFSKALLDAHLEGNYKMAFVTSDFHIFRSEQLAAHAGFTEITHLHGDTSLFSVLSNGLRECLGILKMWIIDM